MLARYFIAVVFLFGSANVFANWDEASSKIEDATSRMLALVEDPELKKPENIDRLIEDIEMVVGPLVDYEYIGKSVMGKFVRRASDEEISRFADIFKTTMLRTYAKAIVSYDFESFELIPPASDSPEPDKQIVSVEVSAGDGTKYSVVYYLRFQDDHWEVVNVLVDGINLRITFRNQFAGLYEEHSSVGAVIDQWEVAMSNGPK